MFASLLLFEHCVGKAFAFHYPEKEISEKEYAAIGRNLLAEKNEIIGDLTIKVEGLENAKRPVRLVKMQNHMMYLKE